jgi:cyclopropane-fatty-acyl-phospholipid synthase
MSDATSRSKVEELLAPADVIINGERPWDIKVHDDRLYTRILAQGSLGVGESYMDGWWDCDRLDEMFYRVLRADIERKVLTWRNTLWVLEAKLINLQKPSRAFHIGRQHYDRGNDLFRKMLDSRMIYSCGYWKDATTLDEAQEAKLDLVCRKLQLEPGMRLLDIGCGWGGTAQFAAERYGVSAVGITVSEQQEALASELCEGWDVEIRLQDYRDID